MENNYLSASTKHVDRIYLELVKDILDNGELRPNRTGTDTLAVFGRQMRFDLRQGFPLLTTKRVHTRSVFQELLWMLRGSTDVRELQKEGVTIWDSWRRPYTLDREVVLVEPRQPEPSAAFAGNFVSPSGSGDGVSSRLAATWLGMIRRCYDTSHHRWDTYGKLGATVCDRWQVYENFVEDVQKLPHWTYKLKDWSRFELDKDYFGAAQYGPTTSVWLPTEENNMYTKASTPLTVTDCDGKSYLFVSYTQAANGTGMSRSSIHRAVSGGASARPKANNKRFAGWVFEAADTGGMLARMELVAEYDMGRIYGAQWRDWRAVDANGALSHVDQLKVLIDGLRSNPFGRRHIVTAWNPGELPYMALPPCHMMFQCHVHPAHEECGKMGLSLQLMQRSCDSALGIPFNIASYAALTMMIAQCVGMEARDFIHDLGDAHIYVNHIEALKGQLTRRVSPMPRLELNQARTELDQFTYNDIKVVGYTPEPPIPMEVAV